MTSVIPEELLRQEEETDSIVKYPEFNRIEKELLLNQTETKSDEKNDESVVEKYFSTSDEYVPQEVPWVPKTEFYTQIALTCLMFFISHILLVLSMVIATEVYIAYPQTFNNMIMNTFLKYKILLYIIGGIRGFVGLLLLFFRIFLKIPTLGSIIIWFIFVIANAVFGAFVGLIWVDDSASGVMSRLPLYLLIVIVTIIVIITLVVALIVTLLGPANRFAASMKVFARNNTKFLRLTLWILGLVIFFGSLPFEEFKGIFPGFLLFFSLLIETLLFLVVVNEVFDRQEYSIHRRNPIEMSFYMIMTVSDVMFIITILLPTVGIRIFSNDTIMTNLQTSSNATNAETGSKEGVEIELEEKGNVKTDAKDNSVIMFADKKKSDYKNVKKFTSGLAELFF